MTCMVDKIVAFDFSGTIIRKDMAKEASNRRFKMLGKEVDQEWLEKAMATEEHYKVNNEIISKYTGVKSKEKLNDLSTSFFKYHMLGLASEKKDDVFYAEILDVINELKAKGNKIAIFSGIRKDTIEWMLEVLEKRTLFDYVIGQPPQLGISNEDQLKELMEKGEISHVIGDKITDINAGKAIKSKTIFVTWGHAMGDEENKADFVAKNPSEILKIVLAEEKKE